MDGFKVNQIFIFNKKLKIYFVLAEDEWRRQSQTVQRDLPRPLDVNNAILRPAKSDVPLSDLQKVT